MGDIADRLGAAARLLAGLVGLGAALGALAIAHRPGQTITYAGRSWAAATLTLTAGLGLLLAGLVLPRAERLSRRDASRAMAAGITWFAPVFVAWTNGPPIVRSVAMLLTGAAFAFVFDLALGHIAGGVSWARALIVAVYTEAAVAAALLALFRDPYLDPSCWANCAVNSFLVSSHPSLVHTVELADRWFVATAALVLLAASAGSALRGTTGARRRLAPVCVPVIGFAAATAVRAVALQSAGVEDPFDLGLFTSFAITASSLTTLAGGLLWLAFRQRATRRAIGRIVGALDAAPAPGALQLALANAYGDPQLKILYRVANPDRYVDFSGTAVERPAAHNATITRIARDERTLGLIVHDDPVSDPETHLGPAIRLGLENERLRAEALAQLAELRAASERIVETGDHERYKLERDLHDGAQQQLLALSYELRLARGEACAQGDTPTEAILAAAIEDTNTALDQLRELARGIFPAILTDAGLGPALHTLAEEAPIVVEVRINGARRYTTSVEAAAYFAVAGILDDAASHGISRIAVTVEERGARLLVTVQHDDRDGGNRAPGVADRVAALGGELSQIPGECRLWIPCA